MLTETANAILLEAWGDLVDRSDASRFDTGGNYLPATAISDRADGRFLPYYETEQQLAMIRAQARNLSAIDSIAIGAVDSLANYIFGPGFKFTAQCESSPGCRLEAVTQRLIEKFIDCNDFVGELDREIHARSREDGECPVILTLHNGEVIASIVEPDQILQPASPQPLEDWLGCGESFVSSWTFGVHTDARYPQRALGYHVVYDSRGSDWDYVPATRAELFKRNTSRNAKRGISDYYQIVDDMRGEAKLGRNMVEGAALQAAIAWVEESPAGTTQAQMQDLGKALEEGTIVPRPGTTGAISSKPIPVQRHRSGTILRPSPGRKYVAGPMGSERNANFILVAQYILRRIGVRWVMPEYMVSGDASNANYSSTLVAESPFVKARETDQQWYARRFSNLLWKVLRIEFEAGRFTGLASDWSEVESLIDIKVDCPNVATRDSLQLAQTQQIEMQLGLLSPRTAAAESGRDYDAEVEAGAKPLSQTAPVAGMFSPLPNPSAAGASALRTAMESTDDASELRAIFRESWRGYP